MYEQEKEDIKTLAKALLAEGFRVFIAKKGTYGFYTDIEGSRVVSFEFVLGGLKYSGNYKSEALRQTGSGWGLETASFSEMIKAHAPYWAHGGVKHKYTTLKEYLSVYGSSSGYSEMLSEG